MICSSKPSLQSYISSMWDKLSEAFLELFKCDFLLKTACVDFLHDVPLQLFAILDAHVLRNECKSLGNWHATPTFNIALHPEVPHELRVAFRRWQAWVRVFVRLALAVILYKLAKVLESNHISEVSVHDAKLSITASITAAIYLNVLQGISHLLLHYMHSLWRGRVTDGPTRNKCLILGIGSVVLRRLVRSF